MRAIHLLFVILALVLGRSHVCEGAFVLPSGDRCETCPSLLDHHLSLQDNLEAPHGDCHDCCELVPCERAPQVTTVASFLEFGAVADLPPTIQISVPELPHLQAFVLPPSVELYLPLGPPGDHSSRAPPPPFV